MMRVLHLVHQYPPEHLGGTEMYTRAVTRALARSGHQVSVFHRRFDAGADLQEREDEGVIVYAAWSGAQSPARRFFATFGDPAIARAFESVLAETQPEMVHIEHLMGLPLQMVGILERRQIPFVVTLWDYWWVCANAQLITNYGRKICPGPDRLWLNCARCALARSGAAALWPAAPTIAPLFALRERLLRDILTTASGLIVPMPFVKAWYESRGLPRGRIQVLRHGVERPLGEVAPRPNDRCVRFAYVGGLSWQKGVHVLVDAFNQLQGESELWVAGSESFDPAYARALRARAGPRVRFLGVLDRQQVWDHLAQVDVVAVPTLWYETLSFIAHEAYVAKVPVLASRIGVLTEVVRDGVDGLLIPPGDTDSWRDTMQHLLDDPRLLEQLRAGVRPPMTMEEHVAGVEGIYQKVVSGGHMQRSKRP